jgi:hypothetical protein
VIRLFVARYAANGVVAVEILLIPLLLSASFYAEFEYFRYLANLGQLALLGAYTGFQYYLYKEQRDEYWPLLAVGSALALALALGFGLWFQSLWLVLASFFIVAAVIVERKLQAMRAFVRASMFRSLCSLSLLLLVGLDKTVLKGSMTPFALLGLSTVLGFGIWLGLSWRERADVLCLGATQNGALVRRYADLVKKGWLINLTTQLLGLFFFADRDLIRASFPQYLAGYSLAFNVAQLVFVGLNTLAFVAQTDFGENFSKLNRTMLRTELRRASIVFAVLWAGGLGACLIYQLMVTGYHGFILSYVLISGLFGVYFVSATIASAALYFDLARAMALLMGGALLASVLLNRVMFSAPGAAFMWLLVKSGVLLALCGVATTWLIFRAAPERSTP